MRLHEFTEEHWEDDKKYKDKNGVIWVVNARELLDADKNPIENKYWLKELIKMEFEEVVEDVAFDEAKKDLETRGEGEYQKVYDGCLVDIFLDVDAVSGGVWVEFKHPSESERLLGFGLTGINTKWRKVR